MPWIGERRGELLAVSVVMLPVEVRASPVGPAAPRGVLEEAGASGAGRG